MADPVVVTFLSLILVSVGYIGWKIRELPEQDSLEDDDLTNALKASLHDYGLNEEIRSVKDQAESIQNLHDEIEGMLTNPGKRGSFGEQQLETILQDHFPPDRYGTQETVIGSKKPDAYIESTEGIICIDSKFNQDNYQKYVEAEDEEQKEKYRKKFRKDVEKELKKIKKKYIKPDEGTAEIAFAFIPSEAVYYHLITEEYNLVREYSAEGVQVVSPLTLGQKLDLIMAGIESQKLSEKAEQIQKNLRGLEDKFESVNDVWSTLRKQVNNAASNTDKLNRELQELENKFENSTDTELEKEIEK